MNMKKLKLNILGLLICLGYLTGANAFTLRNEQQSVSDSLIMAYPFELRDKDGKLVRMEDFKGKVVILDFWFTGCAPCMALAKPLAQIREYYKTNPEIVFIDINLDKDIKKWKNSLKNGSKLMGEQTFYTDSLSISLSTAPQGFYNPISDYYKIKGVPTWIIIGKKGEIIQRNPPRPMPEINGIESVGSLQFKGIINGYLLSEPR